ncbi:MAG: acetoacetate--CoA ligase [Pseudomonadota bacterium]
MTDSTGKLLWQPDSDKTAKTQLAEFITRVSAECDSVNDYDTFYQWSVDHSDLFWDRVWQWSDVISSRSADKILIQPDAMPGAEWFPGSQLNYAENMLRFRDDKTALIFRSESGQVRRLTYAELFEEVRRIANYLKSEGVSVGDRVAGYMSNTIETIVAMLATASLGAIWSSCSPDFGVKGVKERFSQIEPCILFAINGYQFGGKDIPVVDTIRDVVKSIPSIRSVVMVPFIDEPSAMEVSGIGDFVWWKQIESTDDPLEFVQLDFDHPLYILYSSGTTGAPKCIVHGAGGTLLQHLKEHRLHCDIKREDVLFYFTTCGWMMWNWLLSGLASGCTLLLYDGSPFFPRRRSLWQVAEEHRISVFGTSARYLAALAKARIKPMEDYDLSSLRAVLSTGSPLAPDHFEYVYSNVKSDLMLSSISGGTDIVSCFVLGNPMRPVYKGEIQCRGLGMAVDVYDEDGSSVVGQRGELVCTRPFPSMPLGFWNQPDDEKFHQAYFSRFKGVWAQGDFAELTPRDGIVIYGRSDAVLNPGGVRIGTAEIYRQVEKVDEITESLCIGQIWDHDVRIVLFVVLVEGAVLDSDLKRKIRQVIQTNTTRRHVPKKIISVADIPRTLSGKIVELAVRDIVHGAAVKNTEALANPESLEHFRNLTELAEN